MRLYAIKSKQCATKTNKLFCPEVFLDAVADKLTSTADLFLDAELLSKFYYNVSSAVVECPTFTLFCLHADLVDQFPRELDVRLGRGLSQNEVETFAREDPKVRRHLDVVKRKGLLEQVLKEIEALRLFEAREIRHGTSSIGRNRYEGERKSGNGWGIF